MLGHGGLPEKRLAHIGKWRGHPGETHRVKAVFSGKGLGLGQRIPRNRSNIGAPATTHVIIDQIVDRIGGHPVQSAAHIIVGSAGGIKGQIFDLFIRNQQLGPQPLGIKRQSRLAQHGQLLGEVGCVQWHFAHQ